jgi:hypothetical protein
LKVYTFDVISIRYRIPYIICCMYIIYRLYLSLLLFDNDGSLVQYLFKIHLNHDDITHNFDHNFIIVVPIQIKALICKFKTMIT